MKLGSFGWRALVALLVASGGVRGLASCAEASGDVTGGGLTEAGTIATTPPVFEPPDPELAALVARMCPPLPGAPAPADPGAANEWAGLYRDVFGPTKSPGSCVLESTCHGGPEAAGAQSSAGIECFDERRCCESLFYRGQLSSRSGARPEQSNFYRVLRRDEGDGKEHGSMPKAPPGFKFPPPTLARIADWIRRIETDAGTDAAVDGERDADVADAPADGES